MSMIETFSLNKTFRQAIKDPGLKGSIKHFFTQQYRDKTAVNGIDLKIEEGESVAYVGPNGAGKSTTIKMLSGILVPTSGTLRVNGLVPHEDRIRHAKQIGVVFGQRTQLWWDLPVRESFSLLKDIYEIPDPLYKKNMDRFNDLLGLHEFSDLPARKISLGQRMRADLAAALLHNPPLVFLDEPTIGLDIAVKSRIREFVKNINQKEGSTILLTTHDLEDIKDICRRLVIIDKGRIIYDGTLEKITDAFAQERTLHFQVREPVSSISGIIANLPGVTADQVNELSFSVKFNRFQYSAGEIASKIITSADVIDFRIDEPSIDQIIRKLYNGELILQEEQPSEAIRS
ncbi:ABC transporter ATP-binding protein [Paenibacillus abyssi]|uniref:Sugar ABC transporter ATP-binding protein n=1 Tax=Paenibacillus abyssi TaxID=1340531 RepID=A0A917G7S0_9BACL|nr:ATP-binding cassette domain-containing protein [Paenibacillus abyssi]GGG26043.1 sugar ABC transporter ATP-binding protein [Paenibacillus abyssi]